MKPPRRLRLYPRPVSSASNCQTLPEPACRTRQGACLRCVSRERIRQKGFARISPVISGTFERIARRQLGAGQRVGGIVCDGTGKRGPEEVQQRLAISKPLREDHGLLFVVPALSEAVPCYSML